jgi:TonB family protein
MGLPRFETEVRAKHVPRSLQIIDPIEVEPMAPDGPLQPDLARPAAPRLPQVFGPVEAVMDLVEVEVAQFPVFELPPLPPSVTKALADDEKFRRYETLMPTMVTPELQNRRQVQREFERRIPSSIRYGGADGQVKLLVWIDEEGTVQKHMLSQPSGSRSFDRAVEQLVALLKFRPTHWHGRPIASVVELPFSFDAQ